MSTVDLTDQVHRYTVDEYEDLVMKGAFEDQRVELIEGLILDMSPRSPAHENAVEWLTDWLTQHVDRARHRVRVASSVRIRDSQPEPDLAVVDRDRPRDSHPLSAHLVIEVALSSRQRDLAIKPRVYAPAVTEYWVLDLERKQMVVHRQPRPGGYHRVTTYNADERVAIEHLELPLLELAELLSAIE
jgi:Uma2 family endonuclease